MRVALVSSVGRCGIAEHSDMLRTAVTAATPAVEFSTDADWLNPANFVNVAPAVDVVHLNYHRGLHSQWTPQAIANYGYLPFVITFHDTYEQQPDALLWNLAHTENVTDIVVHEPIHELARWNTYHAARMHYWRQPCPNADGRGIWHAEIPTSFIAGGWRPTLGTLGFDFPWKNYTMLARVTGELGWNLRIVGQVDDTRKMQLAELNPHIWFDGYVDDKIAAVGTLSSCDATAFIYTCANSGTSGAIRVGMTAGKPLIAGKGCRQFRDLEGASDGWPITWVNPDEAGVAEGLGIVSRRAGPQGFHLGLIMLAHDNSWQKIGPKYADLYAQAVRRGQ